MVIFDTEYTSWKGCLEHGWTGNQKKEIVQISAVKISDDLNVLGEFNALYKPKINPILSEYFVNLTHITIEQNLKRLNLNTHNAFYDVYSILEGLRYFYPESMEILKKFLQN